MCKPDRERGEYAFMKFHKEVVTMPTFIELIKKGHAFCHIFKNNEHKKEAFLYTYFVCVDVDNVDITMSDFIANTNCKPSIAYTTFNNKLKGFRYRLVYIVDEPINYAQFPIIYKSICQKAGLLNNEDNCGRV